MKRAKQYHRKFYRPIAIQIETKTINAPIMKLSCDWTVEPFEDIKIYLSQSLMRGMIKEIKKEEKKRIKTLFGKK